VSKSDPSASRKQKHELVKWVITIFLTTIVVSGLISLISDELMDRSSLAVAFVILLVIILIGIVFDIIGVAVTSADETPFHAMAARKVRGAKEAIWLLRRAERVSSICNDVVGDICGVVSGSASAAIAVQLLNKFEFSWPNLVTLLMSALVAGLTVGGKAIGKTFAVNSSTDIVFSVGKSIVWLSDLTELFRKEKRKR
jgi:CBS domain containing-hemolysin-like protein